MHLRSRNFIKYGCCQSVRDVASRISSEESVTKRVGLETIIEDTSDVWSTSSQSSMASQSSHPSQNVGTTIKYNMTSEYYKENSLGVKVYVDPLGRFAVRLDDYEIEF